MDDNQSDDMTSPAPAKSSNTGLIFGVLVVLAIGAFLIFKPKNQTVMEATPTGTTGQATVQPTQATTDVNVKAFTLEAGSFYFKPNMITVKKGDKVKVTINSVDMMHDFVIDELKARTEIAKSGNSASVEFTADTVGSFEFYCSVGQHRKNGMVGTLVVTE